MSVVLALAPAAVLLVLIYKADSADKEPWGLILKCLGFGALFTIPICIIEVVADAFFAKTFDPNGVTYLFLSTLLGVALVEEFFKMLAGLIPTWKNDNFNYVFDGIVYCVAAALGYAALENILYVCLSDPADMLDIALVRALMSVPSHMVDGILMGVFVGYAKLYKYQGKTARMKQFLVFALLAPMAEHCAFDFLASIDSNAASLMLIGLVVAEYVVAFVIVLKTRGKNDTPIPLPQPDPATAPGQMGNPSAPTSPIAPQQPPLPQQAVQPAANPTVAAASSATVTNAQPQKVCNFCPECGTKLAKPSKFCPECGTKL